MGPDVASLLRQIAFSQQQNAGGAGSFLGRFGSFFANFQTPVLIALALALALLVGIILIYRPRMSRGMIWCPFFGLFGGTPTLYLHSRPPRTLFRGWLHRRRHRRQNGVTPLSHLIA